MTDAYVLFLYSVTGLGFLRSWLHDVTHSIPYEEKRSRKKILGVMSIATIISILLLSWVFWIFTII